MRPPAHRSRFPWLFSLIVLPLIVLSLALLPGGAAASEPATADLAATATPKPTAKPTVRPTVRPALKPKTTLKPTATATPIPPWAPRQLSATLKGSGASFPNVLYQAWIQVYKLTVPNVAISYQSVGSGQGISDFIKYLTDFGGTDAAIAEARVKTEAPDALHIPMVMGAVVATYNLPGISNLRFSPATLANIYLGNITRWDHPAIAADNPGVKLPDTDITVVYRSDGSGTTSIWTDYLAKISTDWKTTVGSGTTVSWPVGIGAPGNAGVAGTVKQTEGAIGYVELIYAAANNLPEPAIKNAAGKYVAPTLESVSAAAQGFLAKTPDDLRVNIVNPPEGENAYPIAGYTWVLVAKEQKDEAKAQALTDFLYWALTSGSESAKALNYAPLPDEIREKAIAKLGQISVNGKPAFTMPK